MSVLPPLSIPESDIMSRPRPGSKPKPKTTVDPILRNALRYTISAREYEKLHKYVLSRSRLLKKRMPSVNTVENYMEGTGSRRDSIARDDVAKGKGKGKGKDKGKEQDAIRDPGRKGGDSFNARAIRHALRVFIATGLGMKTYEMAIARLKGGKE